MKNVAPMDNKIIVFKHLHYSPAEVLLTQVPASFYSVTSSSQPMLSQQLKLIFCVDVSAVFPIELGSPIRVSRPKQQIAENRKSKETASGTRP